MPKRVCVYCQEQPGTTRDHVFPFAWFPTTTPARIQKRTVPCCPECNKRLHDAEDAIALDLLFICNPDAPEIAGVQENIFRSWRPDQARAGEDPKHRAGKGLKILRTMEWAKPHPGAPIVFVQKGGGLYRPASPARKLDGDAVRTVFEKFVRGLHYLEINAILAEPGPHPRDAHPLMPLDMIFRPMLIPNRLIRAVDPILKPEDLDPELLAAIIGTPRFTMFGPGFQYRRLRTPEGASMWLFRLWGQLEFVTLAFPGALAEQVERAAGLR